MGFFITAFSGVIKFGKIITRFFSYTIQDNLCVRSPEGMVKNSRKRRYLHLRKRLKMRKTSNCSNANIEEKTLKDKASNFNLPVSRLPKKRLCLKCGEKFLSEGPHNRICVKCVLMNNAIRTDTYSLSLEISDVKNCVEDDLNH